MTLPVGRFPQHTSKVVVVALTSCTLDGAGGLSARSKASQFRLKNTDYTRSIECKLLLFGSNCLIRTHIYILDTHAGIALKSIQKTLCNPKLLGLK